LKTVAEKDGNDFEREDLFKDRTTKEDPTSQRLKTAKTQARPATTSALKGNTGIRAKKLDPDVNDHVLEMERANLILKEKENLLEREIKKYSSLLNFCLECTPNSRGLRN
jgi:hypothetical protein